MSGIFYGAASVALLASLMVVLASQPIHALLYFVVSLLGLAFAIYQLSAPFPAALEVIVYAGAIMVLFVFVVMLLPPVPGSSSKSWAKKLGEFLGPLVLATVLACQMIYFSLAKMPAASPSTHTVKDFAVLLFSQYGWVVEIASFLLLAGLVGAYHLGRKSR